MLKSKILLVVLLLVMFCGCADTSKQIWNIVVDQENLLATGSGKIVWQGTGEVVRNQWDNFVVTDWKNEEPKQMLISNKGNVLLECKQGEQLMQLSEDLIAVQHNGQQWQVCTPKGKEYFFNRADIQHNGDILLCGLQQGGSVLLNPKGEEICTFSQEILWASNELPGWYETPEGDSTCLLNFKGETVYKHVQRMVGQGRVLMKEDNVYSVIQADTGKELYQGDKNWRLYLDNLQLEQLPQGIQVEVNQKQYNMDFVKSWPYQGEPMYYIATGKEMKVVWDKNGNKLFDCSAAQWLEVAEGNHIATLMDHTLNVFDETGEIIWNKQGYKNVSIVNTKDKTVFCAVKDSTEKIDIFLLEGEQVLEDLDEVYEITSQGVSAKKGNISGIFNWDGKWMHQWKI